MINNKYLSLALVSFLLIQTGCNRNSVQEINSAEDIKQNSSDTAFYASKGTELTASYTAYYRTTYQDLATYQALSAKQKKAATPVSKVMSYLYGPLTYRILGGPSKKEGSEILWDQARMGSTGFIEVPYKYAGKWLIKNPLPQNLVLPVPYNLSGLKTNSWLKCTDEAPSHQSEGLLWYFWDPSRPGCDHAQGQQYQMVDITFGESTAQRTDTFPEYQSLLKTDGKDNNYQMTFAFGYVEKLDDPNPDKDNDASARAYRNLATAVRRATADYRFTETPIYEKEYLGAKRPDKKIGTRIQGIKDGVQITINIVMAIDIDQIEIFAKSFAHDHDGFFAWFGHSRVGEGFAVSQLKKIMKANPEFYKLTPNYQIIYWGGCNSYSYFTTPFFNLKAEINPINDPNGTKGLDIISNGLPAIAQLSDANAKTIFAALFNWQDHLSYQQIIDRIQKNSEGFLRKETSLINVLGDEDNN